MKVICLFLTPTIFDANRPDYCSIAYGVARYDKTSCFFKELMQPVYVPLAADLLLLLWPVFFVTAARQPPHLRVRNFKKSASRGSERVASVSEQLCLPLSLRRRKELARRSRRRNSAETSEERPTWEITDASAQGQQVMSAFGCGRTV